MWVFVRHNSVNINCTGIIFTPFLLGGMTWQLTDTVWACDVFLGNDISIVVRVRSEYFNCCSNAVRIFQTQSEWRSNPLRSFFQYECGSNVLNMFKIFGRPVRVSPTVSSALRLSFERFECRSMFHECTSKFDSYGIRADSGSSVTGV